LNFWIWSGFILYRTGFFEELLANNPIGGGLLLEKLTSESRILFWLGIGCFSYLWYRSVKEKEVKGLVEHYDYKHKELPESPDAKLLTWVEVHHLPPLKKHNIADTFTDEALKVVAETYELVDQWGQGSVMVSHLFYTLMTQNRISNVFIRLGILSKDIQGALEQMLKNDDRLKRPQNALEPVITEEFRQALFASYEKAYEAHQDYVSVTELLLATVDQSEQLQDLLYDIDIDKQKLTNVVEWARIRERLSREYSKLRHAAGHRSTTGIDKAMTAVATPYLNQFSEDVTLLAQFGHTDPCVAREKEIEEVFRVVEAGEQSVLLVGDYGVGKKSIVNGIAQKMVEEDVPDRLKDKRLVRLNTSSLLAGTTPAGAVERLITMMNEIARAGNIILYINNIQELMGVSAGGEGQSLDVADTLAEYLSKKAFLTIAITTTEAYAQSITNSNFSNIFTSVEIKEMDENQAIQVLESKVGYLEYKQQVFFSYAAIAQAVKLAKRFLHDTYLPGNALEVISEAASLVHTKKGANALVTLEDVAAVVSQKTNIPVTSVSTDESTKLLHLEEELHKRVIGQDEAVTLVANALRRARAEIRSTTRPIANFLFLGPTGVGKTELAKTIAAVYFGGENRMIRLDMSEYQDKSAIYRLIGTPGDKGSGILTEAVRRNAFTLVLLDELEKADKDVLNLFLQVMDDGRLTDSTGRVVDFTNVILIATSNAGTSYVAEQLKQGLSTDAIKDRLLHGELGSYFKPEFLNRFDGIVLFKPLEHEDIKRIAELMLKRVASDLEKKGIELQVEPEALEFFATVGFDPEFGARPLRRALEERVENKLAELVLSKQLQRRSVVVLGQGGEMRVA
jgi:ATP-dependent Clp protease ATP-binding subunit ClpA